MRMLQDIGCVDRLAAELARQRPFGAGAVADDAADHAAAGRGARDLLDLGLAVDRIERHAKPEGVGDLALLLDGVAVGDAVRRGPGGERGLGLADRGDIEAGAKLGEQPEDLRRRIGLDRIVELVSGSALAKDR